ncbi:hypothetical protein ColLi_09467 [Colletotrichum liriopes]|uniref:Uncharacterized protein n=1 Tax=Colletotrichum liriopes TaxID=708192 RepID=A0AA37GTP9_9PEZI|nr:hypothetical protein ColLi_09467 [Colletotrichum liriopes]
MDGCKPKTTGVMSHYGFCGESFIFGLVTMATPSRHPRRRCPYGTSERVTQLELGCWSSAAALSVQNTTPPSAIGDGSDKIEPSRASRSPLEAAKTDQLSGTSELEKTCLMILT